MLIAVTLSLILLTMISLILLRIFRPDFSYSWSLAASGTFLAWISIFFWQITMPTKLTLFSYSFKSVIDYSLNLTADGINFPYAIGLICLVLAMILVNTLKAGSVNPMGWVNILLFAFLGLLAVLAENPLTLVVAWALIDITGLIGSLNAAQVPLISENAVWSYSVRVIGLGMVLWAGILSSNKGLPTDFSSIPQDLGFILLIGVLVRIGALLINLPYTKNSEIRYSYDITIILVALVADLVLLSRINYTGYNHLLITLSVIFIGIIGLGSFINWLRRPEDDSSRLFWITGLSTLAIAASLEGNPIGSVAWGSSTLFAGGALFFYSTRKKWLTIALLIITFVISSLPFSLTATGWKNGLQQTWISLIVLLPFQSLIIASYIRSIALGKGEYLDNQPNWVKVFYPMGLLILVLTSIFLGLTGWAGAGQIGAWIPAIIVVFITVALSLVMVRIPLMATLGTSRISNSIPWIETMKDIWWTLFRSVRRLTELFSATFEGDGGFLWTILLLVLLVSLIRGFAP
jgi:hypothetical protein